MKTLLLFLQGLVLFTQLASGQNYNTRIGFALQSITTGRYNSAAGDYALNVCSNGYYNTALGRMTLLGVSAQSRQTAIGSFCLMSNTGVNNVGIGENCLQLNTGSYNTAIGFEAGYSESAASNLVAIGFRALYKCTANQNSAVGVMSLRENRTGLKNTALGECALLKNTTGSGNTAIGDSAAATYSSYTSTFAGRFTNTTANNLANVIAIGYQAIATGSTMARIGNSAVVSIGGRVAWSTLSDGRFKDDIRENVEGLSFITKLRPVSYEIDVNSLNLFLKNPTVQPVSRYRQSGFIAQEVEAVVKKLNFAFDGVDAAKNTNDMYALRYETFVVPLVKSVQQLAEKLEKLRALKTVYEHQKLEIETLRQLIASLEEPKP